METIEKSPAMESILKAFKSGYADQLLNNNEKLFFTPEGLATLGTVIGFISGMWLAGKHEAANIYANDFMKWLGYICPFDHTAPFCIGSRDVSVPTRVCQVHSDGTMMGFSLAWFVLLDDQNKQGDNKGRIRPFGIWEAKYAYQMNGGLIFHGSNQENYTVSLNSSIWGIHT